ncbi:hypothetical protein ACT7DE_19185 [Bacillus paranthracis]
MLGNGWVVFVSTACVLAATYGILFVVMAFKHGVIEFKIFRNGGSCIDFVCLLLVIFIFGGAIAFSDKTLI